MGNATTKDKDSPRASRRGSTMRGRDEGAPPSRVLTSQAPPFPPGPDTLPVPSPSAAMAIPRGTGPAVSATSPPDGRSSSPGDRHALNIFGSPLLSPTVADTAIPPLQDEVSSSAPPRIGDDAGDGGKQEITVTWTHGGQDIRIAGTFNHWGDPVKMTRRPDGVFEAKLLLAPGSYEYKFIVDREWKHDARLPTLRNSFGSVNNLLQVALAQTELPHDALTDSFADIREDMAEGRAGSPPGSYGQKVPDLRNAKPPPRLPPQLLQCQLNADPPNNDPTQVKPPNHVMLNHLYALSIKDNVIVMGASHRYKQKFVTTVIYKPLSTD
ncbi:uncharacterized protein MONBRDRAFT_25195 [Monosiga brevicollis MX1]|uniref:Association with the SNF1 complex (ASC) domain-containing protein n=1 Tax=Monosiga brevicollis TaxID=81824 RepID=A9UYP2_MONBE|nr:uncharacterized protein MONBRDRAFT_25195 [Monosiga brevicollis MX1]EDQ89638.1 predicted protein [Monosiga brevicollis MX1]|eukprot:XP_001745667.1 hypothetical protein [Monosiga brevicollis MX1]